MKYQFGEVSDPDKLVDWPCSTPRPPARFGRSYNVTCLRAHGSNSPDYNACPILFQHWLKAEHFSRYTVTTDLSLCALSLLSRC